MEVLCVRAAREDMRRRERVVVNGSMLGVDVAVRRGDGGDYWFSSRQVGNDMFKFPGWGAAASLRGGYTSTMVLTSMVDLEW
jgi:hypothetical protein